MEKVKFVDTSISKSIAELLSKKDHRTLVLWATDCAEHVLPYFEEKCLEDGRPRKAIEAGRAWVRGEIAMSEAPTAAVTAHAATRAAATVFSGNTYVQNTYASLAHWNYFSIFSSDAVRDAIRDKSGIVISSQ